MKAINIYNIWSVTLKKAAPKDLEHCFSIVKTYYNHPQRFYHNLTHIETLISQIEQLSLSEKDYTILINVALFHDVIYKAGRKDNEYKSALFAAHWLSILHLETSTSEMICDIIRSTKSHKSSNSLTQLFLDIDLSILGENQKKYSVYRKQIRREHTYIPNYLYKIGRKRFLNTILCRQNIFYTPSYYEAFESIARKNLKNELKELTSH